MIHSADSLLHDQNVDFRITKVTLTNKYGLVGSYVLVMSRMLGNCQTWGISWFSQFTNIKNDHTKPIVKEMWEKYGGRRPILMLDVNTQYSTFVESIFKPESILVKTPYTSTSGSFMILYLIKCEEMNDWV